MNKKLFIILTSIFFFALFPKISYAVLSGCTANVDPANIDQNSDRSVGFSIQNDDSTNNMVWIKISRPSSSYTITNYSSTGGIPASMSESEFSAWGFSTAPSSAIGFSISVSAGGEESSNNWSVQASDDLGGANPVSCGGSLGMSITNPANSVAPVMSDVTLSNLSDTSITISWTTDKTATSVVDYGTTTDYGSTKSDLSLSTSHVLILDSLTANTTYNYNVKSVDGSSNSVELGNNTFVTAVAGSVTVSAPITVTVTNTTTTTKTIITTPTPSPTPTPDTTRPLVDVTTDFSLPGGQAKPFQISPIVLGTARDNTAVYKVEYSLDNGINYLPVDNIIGTGSRSVSFDFTPENLDDGNYDLKVRAIDSSGNIGTTKTYTLVIDRLSPQVSGVLFSLGPQVVNPRANGSILVLAKQKIKITISEVGGSTAVAIIAVNTKSKKTQKYSLTKNSENSLWSTQLSLEDDGIYQLIASLIDGAGNKTERDLNKVVVVAKGTISSDEANIKDAKVSVYYQNSQSKIWQLWDGRPYSQSNPQNTDSNGNYNLLLPPGRYYIQVEASGFQLLNSEFFQVNRTEPINADFSLKPLKLLFSLGFIKLYLPDFSIYTAPFNNNLGKISSENPFIGQQTPFFNLILRDQSQFSSESLKGKPAVLTFLNTWSPSSTEQVSILDKFSENKNYNSVIIIEGEKSSKVYVFQKRGEYDLPLVSDQDASLTSFFKLNSLPVHFLMDRKGIIRNVLFGTLSKRELEDSLLNMVQ